MCTRIGLREQSDFIVCRYFFLNLIQGYKLCLIADEYNRDLP